MLTNLGFHTTIPAKDLERARQYYAEKLGLTPTRETAAGLIYEGRGEQFFILFPSAGAGMGQSTQMSWETDDIEGSVNGLKARGVVFMDYDLPDFKTVNSIAMIGSHHVAWFNDSEGNILSLIQWD